jgi:hypothetical protein
MRATRLVILAAVIGCASFLWGQAASPSAPNAGAPGTEVTSPNAPTQPAAATAAPTQNQNPQASQPATGQQSQNSVPQADPPPANVPDPPAAGDPPPNATNLAPVDNDKTRRSTKTPQPVETGPALNFDQVVERISERELLFLQNLKRYQPLVETYLQYMKPDKELGAVPSKDQYFLGRLELQTGRAQDVSFIKSKGHFHGIWDQLTSIFNLKFMPLGFAQMVMPDNGGLNAANYDFQLVRREFLGDLRCLVIDVRPKQKNSHGRFLGRIWVEDHDYNIVRFNGTYTGASFMSTYLHFDSWRLNMQPGVWLPAFVYSEESDLKPRIYVKSVRFKAQTRLWGYGLHAVKPQTEHTAVMVDDAQVKDQSASGRDALPVEAQREWEHQAEQNVLERLTRAGMLAQPGDVDKILETVVNNMEITDHLDISPPVHCRVLLTTPMESFTVGHTIVLSRGLIDVLPDEATLAAFLAHELAHIALGHRLDTQYAFMDRMIFPDEAVYRKMHFHKDGNDEKAADEKALEILRNSPYADKLASVGLFLKMLETRHNELPSLVAAHLGNSPITKDYRRLPTVEAGSPALRTRDVAQLPALPLGSRVHVDPFNDRLELNKAKAVPLLSAREKMSFEVTPVFPYLTRYGEAQEGASVANATPSGTKQ